jgi:hypothetical protein
MVLNLKSAAILIMEEKFIPVSLPTQEGAPLGQVGTSTCHASAQRRAGPLAPRPCKWIDVVICGVGWLSLEWVS